MKRPWIAGAGVASVLACVVSLHAVGAPAVRSDLPARLSDQDYWRLITDFSEPNGYFRSDNLLSNEIWFQTVIPDLLSRTKPGP